MGSNTYTEKAKIAQTLMQLSNTALYQDPLVSNWINPEATAKALIYSTGLDKFDNIVQPNARVNAELEMRSVAESAQQVLEEQQVRGIANAQQGIM
jgi:hypothetical protein